MKFQGQAEFQASVEKLWELVASPQAISDCLPGVERFEAVGGGEAFKMKVKAGFSFVKGSMEFEGRVHATPHTSVRLEARGKGVGSSVELTSEVRLQPQGESQTLLVWESEVKLGGLLRPVSQSLIKGAADKIIEDLARCLQQKLEAGGS